MTSKRSGIPWMSADDYGRSLTGLGVNLLVRVYACQRTRLHCISGRDG